VEMPIDTSVRNNARDNVVNSEDKMCVTCREIQDHAEHTLLNIIMMSIQDLVFNLDLAVVTVTVIGSILQKNVRAFANAAENLLRILI